MPFDEGCWGGHVTTTDANINDLASANISARLERLPFSRWHVFALTTVGMGNFFDAFDSLTIAFVLPVLVGLWALTPSDAGFLISAGYIGQLIGAFLFSMAAERFGRRQALAWSIWIVALFSCTSAFAWNYVSFFAFRLFQGVGLGGEVPVAATYLNEISQSRIRGRLVILLQSAFALGILVCSLVAVWLVPHFGWQSMFILGTVPVILAIALRKLLPESPRWLASQGRIGEAEENMLRIEQTVMHSSGQLPPPANVVSVPMIERKSSWLELLSPEYRLRTICTSVAMLCTNLTGYGLLSWMPTIYRTVYKLPVQEALAVSLIGFAAVFLGGIVLSLFIDKVGRRPSFVVGFSGSALPLAVLYFVAQTASLNTVIALVSVGLFFITFLLTGGYLYAAEIYPTRIRALGTGLASAWFRIGSILGPTVVGLLLTFGTINTVFLFFAASALVGALMVAFSFVETKGRVLEELAR
jgi:MFS transporter, putative metabolite:H+ symporter